MSLAALLGEDFTSREDMRRLVVKAVRLEWEQEVSVNFINSLISINYIDSSNEISEHLDINSDIPYEVIEKKITKIYNQE